MSFSESALVGVVRIPVGALRLAHGGALARIKTNIMCMEYTSVGARCGGGDAGAVAITGAVVYVCSSRGHVGGRRSGSCSATAVQSFPSLRRQLLRNSAPSRRPWHGKLHTRTSTHTGMCEHVVSQK